MPQFSDPIWQPVTLLIPEPCVDVRIREVCSDRSMNLERIAWRCYDDPDAWYDTRTLEPVKSQILAFAYLGEAKGDTP